MFRVFFHSKSPPSGTPWPISWSPIPPWPSRSTEGEAAEADAEMEGPIKAVKHAHTVLGRSPPRLLCSTAASCTRTGRPGKGSGGSAGRNPLHPSCTPRLPPPPCLWPTWMAGRRTQIPRIPDVMLPLPLLPPPPLPQPPQLPLPHAVRCWHSLMRTRYGPSMCGQLLPKSCCRLLVSSPSLHYPRKVPGAADEGLKKN